MNFEASLRYLDSFINYEKALFSFSSRRWNLSRMKYLLRQAGHPERNFFPILIAGTKGKGSTGYFLEQSLKSCGLRVGFYSSPHLEDVRERIRVGGKNVSTHMWASEMTSIQTLIRGDQLPPRFGEFSYFEVMTLLAAKIFKRAAVDIGIFEIGMGGRYDAANAIASPLVLLTPIHYDHEAFLGTTIEKIAAEKAAIIHPRSQVVMAPQHYESAEKVIREKIRQQKAICYVSQGIDEKKVGLRGRFQRVNAGTALKAIEVLRRPFGWDLDIRKALQGIENARQWPGRLERLTQPDSRQNYLLDVAHNPASIRELVFYIKKTRIKYPLLVFGVSRDKNMDKMVELLSEVFEEAVLTPFPGSRAREVSDMVRSCRPYFNKVYPCGSSQQAYQLAGRLEAKQSLVVVTGSFYLVGQFRKWIGKKR